MRTQPDAGTPDEGSGAATSGGKKPSVDLEALFSGTEVDFEYGHDDFVAAGSIKPMSPRWYWRRRVVQNDLNILAGTQGLGKSQVTCAMAAEATQRGETVLIISAEDSPETTIVPRLLAADVRMYDEQSSVPLAHIWRQDRGWSMDDAVKLQDYIYRLEASLVIIDPVAAFAGKADAYKDQEVRGLLAPLRTIAEDQECTILAVMHLKKGQESEAINSVGGSIAWTAAPRSVLILKRDPHGERNSRILWHAKCNVGPEQPAIACVVEGVEYGEIGDFETSCIRWGDERPDLDIETAFAPVDARIERPSPAFDGAVEFLKKALGDGEWHPSNEVNESTEHSDRSLTRARKALKVESSNRGGVWFTRWPAAHRGTE